MIKLLLILSLITTPAKLLLKGDLKRDRAMLNEHGTYISNQDKRKLLIFDKYSGMDLSAFDYSITESGKHIIRRWRNASGLTIYQVETILIVDTELELELPDSLKGTPSATKGSVQLLKFRTYIIDVPSKERLLYQTQDDAGLNHFNIGSKTFKPAHEYLMWGAIHPNDNEILKLIASIR